jgi:hypothetical protein
MSPAPEREAEVALPQVAAQVRQGVGGGGKPRHRPAARRIGGRLGDEQPRHAGEVLGALARRVDVEHDDVVGGGKRLPEPVRLPLGAREQVRLEGGHARGGERRAAAIVAATSVRVVGVVVDHASRQRRSREAARSRRPGASSRAGRRPRWRGRRHASRAA